MLLGGGRHILAGREPQAHVEPLGVTFSVADLLHVHSPAGRARHEHRGPWTVFSVVDLAQLQLRADCLPQEQVACWAQAHSSLPWRQHVAGLVTGILSELTWVRLQKWWEIW